MTARATAAEGGGGLVAVFHPSPLILAARAASTSANDCQTVTDPRRHSSRLTIIHLAPLPRLDAGPADKKIMDRHDPVSPGRGTFQPLEDFAAAKKSAWKRSSLER